MKTDELLSLLEAHPNKKLLFEYTPGNYVAPNYHITEVKNITIDSVNCGAGVDFWKETIIQLWESPEEKDTSDFMTASKALGILNKVDQIKPMQRAVEVKFEYSNRHFHTAQLFVNDVKLQDDTLMFELGVEQTDCKAKETCGVPAETNAVSDTACCTPGGGCC